jgi:predicted transcriptional regulator
MPKGYQRACSDWATPESIFGMTLKHGGAEMKTVTLEVATLQEVKRRAQAAFTGRKQGARISFATPELLFQVMTAKRWELLRTMTGAGPLAIREAARRVDRDVKGVHGDVHALLKAGILQKTGDGLIIFPFDAVRVDIMLHAA